MKLDIKRFYVPFDMNLICSECKKDNIVKANTKYINYPDSEKRNVLYWCCPHCKSELEMIVHFNIKINPQFCSTKLQ